MDKKVSSIEFEKIRKIILKHDKDFYYSKVNIIPDETELVKDLKKYIKPENFTTKAVIGIDIYRYSSYEHFEQTLIPFLFKELFQTAVNFCLENNEFVFQKNKQSDFEKSFLSTGDGGYLILDTPIHALFFAINFELAVRLYNSYHLFPKLRKIIGEISLRYAITYDAIYYFNNNFYGRAIINNARILEKDNLNRCLIDKDTYTWFQVNTDGTENLQVITLNEIANILDFKDYDRKLIESGKNFIIAKDYSREYGIINSDILKIGKIQSKDSSLDIYNLHLQISMKVQEKTNPGNSRVITISLGNLNTTGI
ncbi:MAG: hypothetical protein Kow0068_14320 [Marinilabiliales bacterium]